MRYLPLILLLNTLLVNGQESNSFDRYKVFETNLNNSKYDEFQDCFYFDGFLMSANYKPKGLFKVKTKSRENYYQSYYVKIIEKSKLAKPQAIDFNSNEYSFSQPSCLTIDSKGNCVFCANLTPKRPRSKLYLTLFQGEINGNVVNSIKKLEFCLDDTNYAHPSLSSDGQFLYFVIGGAQNSDIYYSTIKDGVWSVPQPINEINSEFSEFAPVIVNDSILIFSSNRSGGWGGLDLYYSIKTSHGWSIPVNMGQSINSAFDEYKLILDSSLEFGYLTSDRSGTDNIYFIEK